MQLCDICTEEFQCPVALPCGHVFCKNCILRAIDAIKDYSTLHTCPTCRTRYTVASVDPATIPPHLRPHLTPSVRKLYLSEPSNSPRRISSNAEIAVENGRLNAENTALRVNCEMWRKRAEAHGAAMLNLLNAARLTKEQASRLERERDELQKRYETLKRQLSSAHDQRLLEPLEIDPAPSLLMQSPGHLFSEPLEIHESRQELGLTPSALSAQARNLQLETTTSELQRPAKRMRRSSMSPQT